METKDLFYIGALAYLAYLLAKKNSYNEELKKNYSDSTALKNGGLNLGQNMDLPNLTPTPPDGMSTEDSLNQGNISPLIKEDNEPTQIFGLPLPFGAVNYEYKPTTLDNIIESVGTTPKPIDKVLVGNSKTISNIGLSKPIQPLFTLNRVSDKPSITTLYKQGVIGKTAVSDTDKSFLSSQCGNNFSIPNGDKEGSYTNYWFDGTNYNMQTISPMMQTAIVKIGKDLFDSGCLKFIRFKAQGVTATAPVTSTATAPVTTTATAPVTTTATAPVTTTATAPVTTTPTSTVSSLTRGSTTLSKTLTRR